MNKRAKSNSIRIIAGQWRGRKLEVLDVDGLRPTTDRVRETLFNWLMHDVQDARCLDLFAGSGVLGLESLSRGARFVQFVEINRAAAQRLTESLRTLRAQPSSADVRNVDAKQFLARPPTEPFDLVFLDPPFAQELLPEVIEPLSRPGWLSENALIYLEQPSIQSALTVPAQWNLHREGRAGQSRYSLYSLSDS